MIGVTGTKGKSTTAALAAHLARAAGVDAELAGNIGVPRSTCSTPTRRALAVVELSSYQIADLAVGPEVARRHEPLRRARRLARLRAAPTARTSCGSCGAARRARGGAARARQPELDRARRRGRRGACSARRRAGTSRAEADRARRASLRAREPATLPLPGEHNALNLCAALAGARGGRRRDPPTCPRRSRASARCRTACRPSLERDGVTWVDDSISTTPESALAALASFPARRARAARRRPGPRAGLRRARRRARRAAARA